MRTRLLSFALLFVPLGLLTGPPSGAAHPQEAASGIERLEQLLTRVRERQQSVETLRAAFVEHKESSLLLAPLEAHGEFYYHAPDRVRWEYEAPERMVLVIRDGELTSWYQDLDKARRMSIGRQSQRVLRYLGMGGSVDELLSYFDVALRLPGKAGERYRLALTPRYPRIAKRITKLTVWIDSETYLPVRFLYVEPDGDRTEYRFLDMRVNEPMSAELFRLDLPPDVRIEDMARLRGPASR